VTRAAIKHAEERLRAAVLAGDVAALDALLHDAVVFVGADGSVLRKEDDLALYRSSAQRVSRYDVRELVVELHGPVAVACVRVEVAGDVGGAPFEGAYRYTRTYVQEDGAWRIVAAHASRLA
jgi:ketosteroid isomerase-like protein